MSYLLRHGMHASRARVPGGWRDACPRRGMARLAGQASALLDMMTPEVRPHPRRSAGTLCALNVVQCEGRTRLHLKCCNLKTIF